MKIDKIDYSFDDEVVTKFSYDSSSNQIEVQFEGYYADGNYIESPCSLIIEKWQTAKSKMHGEKRYDSLESHLGIFSMILSLESSLDKLELSINTVDDKYLELLFEQPKVRIEKSV
jgi:hypothetical protein